MSSYGRYDFLVTGGPSDTFDKLDGMFSTASLNVVLKVEYPIDATVGCCYADVLFFII